MKVQFKLIVILTLGFSLALFFCGGSGGSGGGGQVNGYDVNLSSLTVSEGVLSPEFSQSITSYNVEVVNSTTSITLSPEAADDYATVKVNSVTVASGMASGPISLNSTTTNISVVVTAPDGKTTKTYTIIVTKLAALSDNANLSGLSLSAGILTPGFGANTLSYTVQVPNGTTSITLTPILAGVGATVKVNNVTVTSGMASDPISLSDTTTDINIVVTAQNTTTIKIYTVAVTKLAAPSNNANLSGLSLSAGTVTPEFAVDTLAYTAKVSNDTFSITVTPVISGVGATVKVNGITVTSGTHSGTISLSVGTNYIYVVVTAQDTTTTKTYTVDVTRIDPIPIVLGGAITVDEDGTSIITVKLASVPAYDAVVTITSVNTNLVTVDNPVNLTFTPDNYNSVQNVTLGGVHDANTEYEEVQINATGPGLISANRTVATNEDDGLPGIVADTGITKCYNNKYVIDCPESGDFYGQDGNYADLPAARSFTGPTKYSITEEYTTEDNVTGLVWETCSEGKSGATCTGTASKYTWDDANAICLARKNSNYAGRSDWRLPTWYELATILDYGADSIRINGIYFPGTEDLYYWSSTPVFDSGSAWTVYIYDGTSAPWNSGNSHYVRCVSGP